MGLYEEQRKRTEADKLDDIKNSNTYDELEMSGSRAVWPEVLSIYAVKTTNDPDNPQEVASMTDEKKQLLKDIFWEMNEISYETEEKTETVIVETDDGEGNIVEEEIEETTVYLYITVSHKTVEEMMAQYGFTEDQKVQVAELLAQDSSMWASVLYGIYGADDQIVAVALSQLGNVGGEPYWSWYGFGSRVEWCACFVSWCADQCGYIETGVIPKYAGCVNGVNWFKDRGQWADNDIEPAPGMISSSIGITRAAPARKTANPIIPVSLNGLRTALSTPSKGTPAIAAAKSIMLLDIMKSWATGFLPINSKCHPNGWHLHMNVLVFV